GAAGPAADRGRAARPAQAHGFETDTTRTPGRSPSGSRLDENIIGRPQRARYLIQAWKGRLHDERGSKHSPRARTSREKRPLQTTAGSRTVSVRRSASRATRT